MGRQSNGIIPDLTHAKISGKFLVLEITHSKKLKNDDLLAD
jgi:hypothetical protein